MTSSPIDLWQFLQLAASAGILSAVVSAGIAGVGSWFSRRRQARYLSLQLATLFERYALHCHRKFQLHEAWVSSRGAIGEEIGLIPEVPVLPDRPDVWPLLDPELAHRAIVLPFSVSQRNQTLKDTFDVTGDEPIELAISYTLEGAIDALVLARDLRYRGELPQFADATATLENIKHDRQRFIERSR